MLTERTICFLLLPYLHLMDLSGPAQVFYEASQLGTTRYQLRYAGIQPEVRTEQGLLLGGLSLFTTLTLKAGDFIFIPGIDFAAFQAGKLSQEVRTIRAWLTECQ